MAQLRRSTLFVPGRALDGIEDALASGADLVCIDLEGVSQPDEARRAVVGRMAHVVPPKGMQLTVRVNDTATAAGLADVEALLAEAPWLGGLMLPQVRSADEIRRVAGIVETAGVALELYAIVETLRGLEACVEMARAHPKLAGLYFGGNDMSAALGCEMAWEPLLYARSRVVHAAALAGIPLLDAPFSGSVDDLDGLREDCRRARALGLRGKCARHPRQVAILNEVFTQSRHGNH